MKIKEVIFWAGLAIFLTGTYLIHPSVALLALGFIMMKSSS